MFNHNYGLTLEQALELMKTERLDFAMFGDDFVGPALTGIFVGYCHGKPTYEDGPPIYPESPDAMRILGNFERISAVFSFDTDDAEIISRFKSAVAENRKIDHEGAEHIGALPDFIFSRATS